jgi:hypothetical protein
VKPRSGQFIWNRTTRNFAPVLYLLKYSGTVENALDFKTGSTRIIFCDYD